MIIIYDNDGHIVETSNPVLYQGDAALNRIYVVAPYPNNAAFTISFTLPNGNRTKEYMLVRDFARSEIKSDMLVFKLNAPSSVFSLLSGQVLISVYCYLPVSGANPDIITPSDTNTWSFKKAFDSTTITIIKGAFPTLDGNPQPEVDEWGQIVTAVGGLQLELERVINDVTLNFYTEEIPVSDWTSASQDFAPYQYMAVTHFIFAEHEANYIELINNNAPLFARYGFAAIGPADENSDSSLVLLSMSKPNEDITFKLGYREVNNV